MKQASSRKTKKRITCHIVNADHLPPLEEGQRVLAQVSLFNENFEGERWDAFIKSIFKKFGDNFRIKSCDLLYRHNISRQKGITMDEALFESNEKGENWWRNHGKTSLQTIDVDEENKQLVVNKNLNEDQLKKKYYRGWQEDMEVPEFNNIINELRQLYDSNNQAYVFDGKTIRQAMEESVNQYFKRHKSEQNKLPEEDIKKGSFEFYLEEGAGIRNWIEAGYRYIIYTSYPTAFLAWATSYHLQKLKENTGKDYQFDWVRARINASRESADSRLRSTNSSPAAIQAAKINNLSKEYQELLNKLISDTHELVKKKIGSESRKEFIELLTKELKNKDLQSGNSPAKELMDPKDLQSSDSLISGTSTSYSSTSSTREQKDSQYLPSRNSPTSDSSAYSESRFFENPLKKKEDGKPKKHNKDYKERQERYKSKFGRNSQSF